MTEISESKEEVIRSSETPSNSTEKKAGRKRTKPNNNLNANKQEEKSILNDENVETEEIKIIKTGDVINTSLILVYRSSAVQKHFTGIKGRFYIWDSEIVNNRIRITNSVNGVGDISKIAGWVNVKDIVKI